MPVRSMSTPGLLGTGLAGCRACAGAPSAAPLCCCSSNCGCGSVASVPFTRAAMASRSLYGSGLGAASCAGCASFRARVIFAEQGVRRPLPLRCWTALASGSGHSETCDTGGTPRHTRSLLFSLSRLTKREAVIRAPHPLIKVRLLQPLFGRKADPAPH